jgi:Uncharacterized MobA-related protein
MDATVAFRFGVVILGAGASRRMGTPKLLLNWGSTTVIGHLLQQWNILGATQIAVVRATGATALDQELNNLGLSHANRIINPDPERGMFSSIQTAGAWNGWSDTLTHFVITLGDQPHLQQSTLAALIEFCRIHPNSICQPGRFGRFRHPVMMSREYFFALTKTAAANLGEFLSRYQTERRMVEIDDPGLDLDLDTPEDYARLRP